MVKPLIASAEVGEQIVKRTFCKRFNYLIRGGLVLALVGAGCTSTTDYQRLQLRNRQMEIEYREKTLVLSRENRALYSEKLELEKNLVLLKTTLESVQARIKADSQQCDTFKRRSKQKIETLEKQFQDFELKKSEEITLLTTNHQKTLDSLLGQLDTVSAEFASYKKRASLQIEALKQENSEKKYSCEKEIYALERLKDELFKRLQQSQRWQDSVRAAQAVNKLSETDSSHRKK